MTSIRATVRSVAAKLPAIAKLSGDANTVATQEIKQALEKGLITKAERNLLTRALSESGNSPAAVAKRMDRYVEAFEKVDTNKDGKISKAERNTAQKAVDEWMWKAASTQTPKAEKDRLFQSVVTTTVERNDGKKVQVAEYAIGSLMDKLSALQR